MPPPVLPFTQPGSPAAGSSLADLDAAHGALARAALYLVKSVDPMPSLRPAADAIERAIAATFDAIDGRFERSQALTNALAEVDQAALALSGSPREGTGLDAVVEQLAAARAALGTSAARLAATPAWPVITPAEVLASHATPRLHAIGRASLRPAIRVPAAPPVAIAPPVLRARPTTFEELAAAVAEMEAEPTAEAPSLERVAPEPTPAAQAPAEPPTPGYVAEMPRKLAEIELRRERARECFEEAALAGAQRAPLPGDPWRSSLAFERRLFAAIDHLAILGPVAVAHLPTLFADAPVKDGMHAFALAACLGSFAGRDALGAVTWALLSSERTAEVCEGFAEGLRLAPHDGMAAALRPLLDEPDPLVRALAVDVLGHRGMLRAEELARFARDLPRVAAAALRHLATTPPSAALQGSLDEAARHADPAVREAAWVAMVVSNHPYAGRVLAEGLADPKLGGAAAMLLAIGGEEADARRLVDLLVAGSPAPAQVEAVGWSGAGFAVPRLLDLLEHEDEALAGAAAAALERITGETIRETVMVPAEEIEVPDLPEPSVPDLDDEPLGNKVSDPRDRPPEPALEKSERPSADAARWRAALALRPLDPDRRWRRGQPFSPLVVLAELEGDGASPSERRALHRELVVRTGEVVRFDPRDLVAAQDEALRAYRPIAQRASSTAGRWVRPTRK